MKLIKYITLSSLGLMMLACQNNDIEIIEPKIAALAQESITGTADGYNYVLNWTAPQGLSTNIRILNGNQQVLETTTGDHSFTHENLESNVEYTYIFKLTDGNNISLGTVLYHSRPGASSVSGIIMKQIEKEDGTYDAGIEWTPSENAEKQTLTYKSQLRESSVVLEPTVSQFLIADVKDGEEIIATIVAENSTGLSLPANNTLRIGKTAIGFLSVYPDTETLIKEGDDDEICAWLWLHEEYPSAQYVYFGDIKSKEDLNPYRVLFWMRDLEYSDEELNQMGKTPDDVVFEMPEVVVNSTPFVSEWYKDGGSLLLWSHATVYVGNLGRIPTDVLRSNDHNINVSKGGWNGDLWATSVELYPAFQFKIDHSNHPIFKGLDVKEFEFERDGTKHSNKRIYFKGAGWTEDHNCLFFNLPAVFTGLGNQDPNCYNESVNTYGIIPLGTWDSQTEWISQLNVWEAQQGNTDYKGTIICVGNGGLNFAMRNADGSPDLSAYPSNNPYQGNILTMAKNALEYLKGR